MGAEGVVEAEDRREEADRLEEVVHREAVARQEAACRDHPQPGDGHGDLAVGHGERVVGQVRLGDHLWLQFYQAKGQTGPNTRMANQSEHSLQVLKEKPPWPV